MSIPFFKKRVFQQFRTVLLCAVKIKKGVIFTPLIISVDQTPYFVVATGTPGPIVEVTVQLLR